MEDKKGILLESGTNEFEIIEFSVGGVFYGLNVAKVREVINSVPVTFIAKSHPNLDGIFTLRSRVMPLVNLARSLNTQPASEDFKIIVCEINNFYVGFKVDAVYRIHRISWTQMEPIQRSIGVRAAHRFVQSRNLLVKRVATFVKSAQLRAQAVAE